MMKAMAARKEVTLSLLSVFVLVVIAVALGSYYRMPGLGNRPMHTDEAILGTKLGEFWDSGRFTYDPKDFHGPALHQTTLLWAKVDGWGAPDTWTEADLRFVAALCGLGVLLSTLLFADALGRYGTGIAMLLTAASPMMVYYSRYFIMEMQLVLLVSLMLGCFWRYSQGGTRLWLVLGGCALGFQHATKETFILNIGAAFVGWVVARSLIGEFQPPRPGGSYGLGSAAGRHTKGRASRPWLWIVIPALLISVASYSNGFRDWKPVLESLTTYLSYLERSGGSGHEKPWHYYLTLLVWRKDTLIWTEALIVGLSVVGMVYSLVGDFQRNTARQAFLVFLSVYALVLLAGYSILSYKTPWSILSAQHALTLLAGVGAWVIWAKIMPGRIARLVFNALLAVGIYHLCDQSIRLTGTHRLAQLEYSADPRNPYAYAHTQKSLFKLMAEVDGYAKDLPDRKQKLKIQVVSQDSGWPLHWYWRTWEKAGYQDKTPDKMDADIIVVDADHYDEVLSKITPDDYSEHYPYGLRPGVMLTLFLKKPAAKVAPAPATSETAPASAAPTQAPAEPATPPVPPEGTLIMPPSFSPTLPAQPQIPVLPGSFPSAENGLLPLEPLPSPAPEAEGSAPAPAAPGGANRRP